MTGPRRTLRRLGHITLLFAVAAATAPAYYHYLHYADRSGPFVPMPEKFDLSALHNKTVYFYVSDVGPDEMAPGDSFASVLSQIRLAGATWNAVETSDLRVAFGGLFSPGTEQSRPHIEVLFEEMPPGLLAQGGVTSRAEPATGPGGPFVPILRSVVVLNKDISERPSYGSGFFLTAVHELGHALGLQHTMTSSVMTTEVTRATTKAKPLEADDIAAISLLYPNSKFSGLGSLSGRVTMSGEGVHLASVVAVRSGAHAVSALTHPDGSYRIDGLTPGQYYVYVHPLSPTHQPELGPAEIVLPLDSEGVPIPASGVFHTRFYPGTPHGEQAATVKVDAGEVTAEIDFQVEARGPLQLYDVTTWSFPGQSAVKPAYININSTWRLWLAAFGPGLTPNQAPAPGLRVSVLGNSVQIPAGGVRPYLDPNFLQVNFQFHPFTPLGPRHLVFSAGEDVYVLPAGFTLVNRHPPAIRAIEAEPDAGGNRVAITGSNFSADTRIFFDGIPAKLAGFDAVEQRIEVIPPPGGPDHRAWVVAMNGDGQSSLFVQFPPRTYTYGPGGAPTVSLSNYAVPAGQETMIEVTGVNIDFADGQTHLGFGSSDIVVTELWVVSPTLLRANVAVSASARPDKTMLSVVSGIRAVAQPFTFEVLPAVPNGIKVSSSLVNAAPEQKRAYPGSMVVLPARNLPGEKPGAWLALSLNDSPVPVLDVSEEGVTFQIPSEFSPGPAVLRLYVGGEPVAAVVVRIHQAPPAILAVRTVADAVDTEHPARPGDPLIVVVSGLADPGAAVAAGRVRLNVGGLGHSPLSDVHPQAGEMALHEIRFVLSPEVPEGDEVPLTVSVDDRTSLPRPIPIRGA